MSSLGDRSRFGGWCVSVGWEVQAGPAARLNLDVELLLSAVPLGDQDAGASGNELKGPNRPHICVLSLEQERNPVSALRLG